jgi:hypothetical protein
MTVGVCIPTKGERPHFLERAKLMLSRQTLKPDVIKIVDQKTEFNGVDIALRYRLGFRSLFGQGCDVVLCMEDDDWYSDDYVETMVNGWQEAGMPVLFGLETSIYYNIVARKYSLFSHPGRASMMSMAVTKDVLRHKFDYTYPYLDYKLWKNRTFTKATFSSDKTISVGIKHGFGTVGGAGHKTDWTKFTHSDMKYKALNKFTKEDSVFYKIMAVKDDYDVTINKPHDNPFLSVITRRHGDRRPEGFKRNQIAMNNLKGSWEQILIKDKVGKGLYYANMSFMLASPFITGEYVYMIDDDDFINNQKMIPILQDIAERHNPDVIVFRMTIKNGAFNNHYPSPQCWKEKRPIQAHIGGSCFVVKRELWKQHIHHFGKPRFGDYFFLEALWRIVPKIKTYWCDVLMAETGGKPSHGKTEI